MIYRESNQYLTAIEVCSIDHNIQKNATAFTLRSYITL